LNKEHLQIVLTKFDEAISTVIKVWLLDVARQNFNKGSPIWADTSHGLAASQ